MKKCKNYLNEAIKHASLWHTLAGIFGKLGLLCVTYQVANSEENDALVIVCLVFAALGIILEAVASWVSSLNIAPPTHKRRY